MLRDNFFKIDVIWYILGFCECFGLIPEDYECVRGHLASAQRRGFLFYPKWEKSFPTILTILTWFPFIFQNSPFVSLIGSSLQSAQLYAQEKLLRVLINLFEKHAHPWAFISQSLLWDSLNTLATSSVVVIRNLAILLIENAERKRDVAVGNVWVWIWVCKSVCVFVWELYL